MKGTAEELALIRNGMVARIETLSDEQLKTYADAFSPLALLWEIFHQWNATNEKPQSLWRRHTDATLETLIRRAAREIPRLTQYT